MTDTTPHAEPRKGCPIVRTHQRFLLRRLEFSQQYAAVYRNRMEAQFAPVLLSIQRLVQRTVKTDKAAANSGQSKLAKLPSASEATAGLQLTRVLELVPGVPAICVGVVYKQMKLLPKFLAEYERELVRIDAGGDEDGEEGDEGGGEVEPLLGDEAMAALRIDDNGEPGIAAGENDNGDEENNNKDSEDGGVSRGLALAAAEEHYTLCRPTDELLLEDSSGRILLRGLDASHFCTGLIVGVYGVLLANGSMRVERYAFAGLRSVWVPRAPSLTMNTHSPCYIAFIAGLRLPAAASEPRAARLYTMLGLLVDYLSGNVGDAAMREQARCVTRLVLGGNNIAVTEELKLKKKVRLEPGDHAKLSDEKGSNSGGVTTSAQLMLALDKFIAQLCGTLEVELMPGDTDMSDAFLPQQPIHPVLLPHAARYSTLRLNTNPFTFTAQPESEGAEVKTEEAQPHTANGTSGEEGLQFFVTAGQNVNDVARETRFETRLDTMAMILQSGCACPTAPNTLFSYPFRNTDPFVFTHAPHCLIACDQPRFETRFMTLRELEANTSIYYDETAIEDNGENEEAEKDVHLSRTAAVKAYYNRNDSDDDEEAAKDGVRLICVPSFDRTGVLVLVDVASPTLHTTVVDFSVQ